MKRSGGGGGVRDVSIQGIEESGWPGKHVGRQRREEVEHTVAPVATWGERPPIDNLSNTPPWSKPVRAS